MEFPELKDDEAFLNQVDVTFNSNNLFEEWKKLANTNKRMEILERMIGIGTTDAEGNQKPYFHIEYALEYVKLLTPEEKDRNKKYWMESAATGVAKSEGGGSGSPEGGPEGAPESGGPPSEGNTPTEGGPEGAPAPENTEAPAPESPPPPGGAAAGGAENQPFEF